MRGEGNSFSSNGHWRFREESEGKGVSSTVIHIRDVGRIAKEEGWASSLIGTGDLARRARGMCPHV